MTIAARLSRLETAVVDPVDAEIEAELAKLTPDEQAQFLAECAHDFGLDEQVELKKTR